MEEKQVLDIQGVEVVVPVVHHLDILLQGIRHLEGTLQETETEENATEVVLALPIVILEVVLVHVLLVEADTIHQEAPEVPEDLPIGGIAPGLDRGQDRRHAADHQEAVHPVRITAAPEGDTQDLLRPDALFARELPSLLQLQGFFQ